MFMGRQTTVESERDDFFNEIRQRQPLTVLHFVPRVTAYHFSFKTEASTVKTKVFSVMKQLEFLKWFCWHCD
jgi:hypothetical protein